MEKNNLENNGVMERKMFKSTFLRCFPLQACFSYERMQNVGFAYAMIPTLKKLYPHGPDAAAALKRHLTIFNTTPAMSPFITGAVIAMEEKIKKAKDDGEECDEESINAVKVALMGPLAGIGDSFFWGTFKIIAAGVGTSMAATGNVMGTIIFILLYNIPNLFVRYQGLKLGYKSGTSLLSGFMEGGIISKLTEASKVLGLIVVGSMAASMVKLSTPFVAQIGETEIVFQQIFDTILTGILPLSLTLFVYKLLLKGVKVNIILYSMILIAIAGSILGIL